MGLSERRVEGGVPTISCCSAHNSDIFCKTKMNLYFRIYLFHGLGLMGLVFSGGYYFQFYFLHQASYI